MGTFHCLSLLFMGKIPSSEFVLTHELMRAKTKTATTSARVIKRALDRTYLLQQVPGYGWNIHSLQLIHFSLPSHDIDVGSPVSEGEKDHEPLLCHGATLWRSALGLVSPRSPGGPINLVADIQCNEDGERDVGCQEVCNAPFGSEEDWNTQISTEINLWCSKDDYLP